MPYDTTKGLRRLLAGRGAHADVLASINVSFELASRHTLPNVHTIWQLVWHLNFWMEYELDRLDRHPRPYPEHASVSWPSGAATSDAWRHERERFTTLLARLNAWAGVTPDELQANVANPPGHEERRQTSVVEVLWQLVAHNSYHIGQIVIVRQALGAWPPTAGGDSW